MYKEGNYIRYEFIKIIKQKPVLVFRKLSTWHGIMILDTQLFMAERILVIIFTIQSFEFLSIDVNQLINIFEFDYLVGLMKLQRFI